jgi:type I restriction enzyme S subunit
LNYGREVKLSEAFNISPERYDESPEIMLQNDDILLCKDGAGIGKIGIVKNLAEPASINSSLLLIRSGKYFVPEFLYFFLAGPTMQRLVQERMTGSAVPHLFQRDVKEFVLEIPPISEQREIVRRVEELLAFADGIEQKANAALQRVNNLTQSILAKAFRGELTANWRAANPESICGENSAEALLEKIKAEREAFKPVKKSSVRKKS